MRTLFTDPRDLAGVTHQIFQNVKAGKSLRLYRHLTVPSALTAFVATLLLLTGCKSQQKAVTYPPDQLAPAEKALLWKISGNGLKKPSYLFGTIHLIPKNDLQFSEATTKALLGSERIAFEIDMKEMMSLRTQFSLLTKAFMKDGVTIKDLLSAEDYQLVQTRLEEKGFGKGMFERMKPMFLSMMLGNEDGAGVMPQTETGHTTAVELELWRIAKRNKIKSAGLESVEYQLSVFDAIPYKDQAKMLVESLRATDDSGSSQLDEMIQMYKSQDIQAMQKMIASDESMKQFESALLGNRNRNWIPVMGRMMRTQSTFFAVGAGHLGGQEGVIALLRKEGYRVAPL